MNFKEWLTGTGNLGVSEPLPDKNKNKRKKISNVPAYDTLLDKGTGTKLDPGSGD